MSKKKPKAIDVRAILERPVGKVYEGGPSMCAFEASMRRSVDEAIRGNMRAAKRFLHALEKCGILHLPDPIDDHQYVLYIPKDWDDEEWHKMFDAHGPPPWLGDRDGFIPEERWLGNYGEQPWPGARYRRKRRKR